MENLDLEKLFNGIYKNKKVLITGHTGFKGSWLALWLQKLGAKTYGIALEPPTEPNHFNLLNLDITNFTQNICEYSKVEEILKEIDPDIIFHLAAQPLVRLSYKTPLETLSTNIMGTANVLEAAKKLKNLKAIVAITSDKCYENKEWVWGYRENEKMGGQDPYSASKGAAEIIIASYRNSFFSNNSVLIASARAGNVIGGGDWAEDRILTDIINATTATKSVYLRFPKATRPWQYVLEPLSGYLCLGQQLLNGKKDFAEAWNFGPSNDNNVCVLELVKEAKLNWNIVNYEIDKNEHPHEAHFLMLDSTKAEKLLKWKSVWNFKTTVSQTISWYKTYYENNKVVSEDILFKYISDAQKNNIEWSRI